MTAKVVPSNGTDVPCHLPSGHFLILGALLSPTPPTPPLSLHSQEKKHHQLSVAVQKASVYLDSYYNTQHYKIKCSSGCFKGGIFGFSLNNQLRMGINTELAGFLVNNRG